MDEMRHQSLLLRRLASDGFVLLPQLCNAALIENILAVAVPRVRAVREALGTRPIGIGSAAGFNEIVQRSPGRWDVPIPAGDFELDALKMPWSPLVERVLGADAEHSFSGVVFSEPGSPAQCWHIDSPHIAKQHLPPHALNVMVALHDIPLEMGPTELARASHRLSNHLHNSSLLSEQLVYQHAGTTPETLVQDTQDPVPEPFASPLDAGSCLLFDDRLLHRGLANRSGQTRRMAYFAYRRKGYAENTHFEAAQSVFDQDS